MNHHDISSPLAAEANAIVRKLGGIAEGAGGLCLCPAHDDTRPSLSVRPGERAILLKCFAGCNTIDVLRALRLAGVQLGGNGGQPAGIKAAGPGSGTAAARRLWQDARHLSDDRATAYLRARMLLPNPALRFHARTPLGRGKGVVHRPALLAAVVEDSGVVAVQRCFLDADPTALARDMDAPRRMLGTPGRGAVRLAPAGKILGLAEGVETALSAMRLLRLPVWAALGAERFGRVAIPDIVEHLVLLPDNDRAGALADARAREAYALPGRVIATLSPPAHLNDWNDLLRGGGKGAGEEGGSAG